MRSWWWLLVLFAWHATVSAGSCPDLVYRGVAGTSLARAGDYVYVPTFSQHGDSGHLVAIRSVGLEQPRVMNEVSGVFSRQLASDGDWLYSLTGWAIVAYTGALSGELAERSRWQVPSPLFADRFDAENGFVLIGTRDHKTVPGLHIYTF